MPKSIPSRKGLEPISSIGETKSNMFMPDDSKRAHSIVAYFEIVLQQAKEPTIEKIGELNSIKCRMAMLALEQISGGIVPHTSGFWLQELRVRTAGPWNGQPYHEEIEQSCRTLENINPAFHTEVSKSLGIHERQQSESNLDL